MYGLVAQGAGVDERMIYRSVRPSPGWCEARYLRTVEWLAERNCAQREYMLLSVFALLDGQPGFVLDLNIELEQRFGASEASSLLRTEAIALTKRQHRKALPRRIIGGLERAWHRLSSWGRRG